MTCEQTIGTAWFAPALTVFLKEQPKHTRRVLKEEAAPRHTRLTEALIDQSSSLVDSFMWSISNILVQEDLRKTIRRFAAQHIDDFERTSETAITNALTALDVLGRVGLLPFRVSQTTDGGVLFEIRGAQARSLVEFFADGQIAILEKIDPQKLVEFSAKDLESQIELLTDARR